MNKFKNKNLDPRVSNASVWPSMTSPRIEDAYVNGSNSTLGRIHPGRVHGCYICRFRAFMIHFFYMVIGAVFVLLVIFFTLVCRHVSCDREMMLGGDGEASERASGEELTEMRKMLDEVITSSETTNRKTSPRS